MPRSRQRLPLWAVVVDEVELHYPSNCCHSLSVQLRIKVDERVRPLSKRIEAWAKGKGHLRPRGAEQAALNSCVVSCGR